MAAIVLSGPVLRVGDELVIVLPRELADVAAIRDGQPVVVTIRTDLLN